jgi:heme/copper-type cytochrome/quinol oxidase subunit 2
LNKSTEKTLLSFLVAGIQIAIMSVIVMAMIYMCAKYIERKQRGSDVPTFTASRGIGLGAVEIPGGTHSE